MSLKSRLTALEARHDRVHPAHLAHFTSILFVPAHLEDDEWEAWIAAQPCRCGRISCPERSIGAILPEKYDSDAAWVAAAQAHQARMHPPEGDV